MVKIYLGKTVQIKKYKNMKIRRGYGFVKKVGGFEKVVKLVVQNSPSRK
jgi:hypothetical protein